APPIIDGAPADAVMTLDATPADAASRAAGENCAMATAITPGTLTATTVGLMDDYNSSNSCAGDGPDGVYSIMVPSGQILRATLVPMTNWDAQLVFALMADCTTPLNMCLSHTDLGASGEQEELVYYNSSGATQTVDIVVDGYNTTDSGPFRLETEVHVPPP